VCLPAPKQAGFYSQLPFFKLCSFFVRYRFNNFVEVFKCFGNTNTGIYKAKMLFLRINKTTSMKTSLALTLFLATLVFFTACEPEYSFETLSGGTGGGGGTGGVGDTTGSGGGGTTGIFTAKIDGAPYTANRIAQGAKYNDIINISGLSLDKKTIAITVKDSGVHNYTLAWDASNSNAGAFMDSNIAPIIAFTSNAGDIASEGGGFLNITAIDAVNKKMSGTFGFKAKRPLDNTFRTITEGIFNNIPYTTAPPTASATDTFNVKIDGVAFTSTSIFAVKTGILNSIAISGVNGVKTVAINFPDDITNGTFTIGGPTDNYYGQYNASNTSFNPSISGTLHILDHNTFSKRIRGTFSYQTISLTGGVPFSITDGVFAVTYQ
jgi:hypothetical protein